MLLWSKERGRRWIASVALGGQQQKGIAPKDWKRTWLLAASNRRDKSLDEFSGNWLAYASASARKDASVTGAHLERCLELVHLVRPTVRDLVAQEAAIYTAWFRKESALADKWFDQVRKPKLMTRLQQLRAGIALHCAHRKFPSALDDWQEGLTFINKLPASLERNRLIESWQEWKAEIQDRQSQNAVV